MSKRWKETRQKANGHSENKNGYSSNTAVFTDFRIKSVKWVAVSQSHVKKIPADAQQYADYVMDIMHCWTSHKQADLRTKVLKKEKKIWLKLKRKKTASLEKWLTWLTLVWWLPRMQHCNELIFAWFSTMTHCLRFWIFHIIVLNTFPAFGFYTTSVSRSLQTYCCNVLYPLCSCKQNADVIPIAWILLTLQMIPIFLK